MIAYLLTLLFVVVNALTQPFCPCGEQPGAYISWSATTGAITGAFVGCTPPPRTFSFPNGDPRK